MSTGTDAVLREVSRYVAVIESSSQYDVHTVLLVLNGQHGGFDLRIEATDADLTDHAWEGTINAAGKVRHWHKVIPRYSPSLGVKIP